MTSGRCSQCGGPLPPPARTGRRRVYCSPRCRSLASYHRARARAAAEALTGEELIAWLAARDPLAGLSPLPDPLAQAPVSG
jgi:predicted nucleic acid-binding Zn ribbon protein